MTDSIDYLVEKFNKGIFLMVASSERSLAKRLGDAFLGEVHLADASQTATIDDELRDRIRALHERMTERPDPSDIGTIRATVELMTEDDARELANEMYDIHLNLLRAYYRAYPRMLDD